MLCETAKSKIAFDEVFITINCCSFLYYFFFIYFKQHHVNGLESLRDELNLISKTKKELEERLQTTVIEKETIFASLEEALERINTLDRHVRDQDKKLQVEKISDYICFCIQIFLS